MGLMRSNTASCIIGNCMIQFVSRRNVVLKRQRNNIGTKKHRVRCTGEPDEHYGPSTAVPNIDDAALYRPKEEFLEKLKKRVYDQHSQQTLQALTVQKHDSAMWRKLRKDYLTASNFGTVIKRCSINLCYNLVK